MVGWSGLSELTVNQIRKYLLRNDFVFVDTKRDDIMTNKSQLQNERINPMKVLWAADALVCPSDDCNRDLVTHFWPSYHNAT